MKKINLGLVFGGRSAEHEISILSAAAVYKVIDREKYNVIPAAITIDGEWL
ncbi:MAG: D-alanine--D-alanine ligase A, partial [Halanaerobiales bacterium]